MTQELEVVFRSVLDIPYDVQTPLLHIADKGLVKGPEVHQSRNQCKGNEDKGNKGHGQGLEKWPMRPPRFCRSYGSSFAGHFLIVTGHLAFVNTHLSIFRRPFDDCVDIVLPPSTYLAAGLNGWDAWRLYICPKLFFISRC